jgi:predicted nuclease of predicted toxin-antitoxin system
MKIILDENLPKPLKQVFTGHFVTTVQEEGLSGMSNGILLACLEGTFDVFITADKNLRYQQNLSGRRLSIVELPTNRLPLLQPMSSRIAAAIESITPGSYIQIAF